MRKHFQKRDYSLSGQASKSPILDGRPVEGRVKVKWWTPSIDMNQLVALRKTSNWPALGNFALWILALLISGATAYATWGTIWAVPAFLVYGTIYSSSDARWHELGHGKVFRTRWLTTFFYQICAFMTLREAYLWRYSHNRHHSHTLVVGQDPEIQVARPADLLRVLLDFFFILGGAVEIKRILRHAFIGLGDDEKEFVPEQARGRLIRSSRTYVLCWIALISTCVTYGSILPAMFVILPRFYAGWLQQLMGVAQHAGLQENTSDHRLNTRTIYVNRLFRFLYMNMNYHLEHHVSPTVPYHALPRFHELIKNQCPLAYPSVWAAYREIVPTLWKQAFHDPDTFASRTIPMVNHQLEQS